jgi:hypothetical protein
MFHSDVKFPEGHFPTEICQISLSRAGRRWKDGRSHPGAPGETSGGGRGQKAGELNATQRDMGT